MADDLAWLDATAQAELVRKGDISPLELVEAAIGRIEKVDTELNSVIHHTFDKAIAAAKSAQLPNGPFRGVPFLVKDLYAGTEGDPMHNGTQVLKDANYVAPYDSWLVQRYRRAGFVITGRTNTPEFGLVPTTEPASHGATHNPWNVAHTPGGSSGGSAAAVSAGLVPVAHASDGGGSIRIPASMCGLVGLKVTRGRITLGPDGDESLVSVHNVVTRSVRDTAAVLDATHGPGPGDAAIAPPPARPYVDELQSDPGVLRVGLMATSPAGALHRDCERAVRNAAALLERLGHHVEESHPAVLDDPSTAQTFGARWCVQALRTLSATGQLVGRPLTADDVEPITWIMAEAGKGFSGLDYANAMSASAAFTRKVAGWWDGGFDLLLTPTLGAPPPKLGELLNAEGGAQRVAELVPYTTHFNVTGQPAISLPLHWNDDGLPIGVQLAAAHGREDLLIRIAAQLEAAAPWAGRRPPVSA
ncbi:MAG TPA: amidase [Acidimicrobiales bacterium]|nr:amidase [Acidimicrobiales bacterium]